MKFAKTMRAAVVAAAVGVLVGCGGGSDTGLDATAKAWTVDADGWGFVGKGDVQLALGWNNKQLQDNANNVTFRAVSTTVSEVSWTCTNSNNQNEQQRERTTTTTAQGVLSSVARERNQITGFNLTGYSSTSSSGSTSDGPQLNSCPSGPWALTVPAGDPVVIESSSAMQVGVNGAGWVSLNPDASY
jgi:hypothetical protein